MTLKFLSIYGETVVTSENLDWKITWQKLEIEYWKNLWVLSGRHPGYGTKVIMAEQKLSALQLLKK